VEVLSVNRRRALLALGLGALFLAACAQSAPSGAPAAQNGSFYRDGATAPEAAQDSGLKGPGGAAESVPNAGVLGVNFQADRVLILTAHLDMKAPDPWTTADRVQSIAMSMGGDVVSVAQAGQGEQRSAMVTVRVPKDRFNDALNQLKAIQDIEVNTAKVDGVDRTEQFVDLEARLKAKQAEEQRYLALLNRAQTVDEILKIDQVLSNVRVQIEQLTGQLNSLRNRSAMSTITVSIAPLTVTPPGEAWQPLKTFQAALASVANAFRVVGDVLIWALVWAWLPVLLFIAATFAARVRTRPAQ
jgi:hypothetical protein